RGDAHGMRHLNQAMILNPLDPSAHLAAARVLAATGHRPQATIEYRAAFDRGELPSEGFARELLRTCGPEAAVQAVPTHPPALATAQAVYFDRIGQAQVATALFHRVLEDTAAPNPQRVVALRALVIRNERDQIDIARRLAAEALETGDVTRALEVLR